MTDNRSAFAKTISGARMVALVCLGLAALLLLDASEGGSKLVPLALSVALAAGVVGWLIPGTMPRRYGVLSIDNPSNDP